jgi:hypothetical protein
MHVEFRVLLADRVVCVQTRQVVDTRNIEENVLSFLRPEGVLLDAHLPVGVQALWARPPANELYDRVRAVRSVQRTGEPNAN